MTPSPKTLRLNFPQWQGGNMQAYHFGSRLLSFLAPDPTGPVETVPVPAPVKGETLALENGIVARSALLQQARSAWQAIDRHSPDRIVALGGDCLIDLAPIAWLNQRYDGKLGVLWIDAHPDVTTLEYYPHAHAHVLGTLLGRGDKEFTAQVPVPLDPSRVIYAGLDAWSPNEAEVIKSLGLKAASSASLATTSAPVTDWIKRQGIEHVAVHFDLDVLDPCLFRPLNFNEPGLPPNAYPGVPRGRMRPEEVVRLLQDVSAACNIVGLAITEHLPWDAIAMRDMLAELPLLGKD
jgi:arginase